MIKTWLRQFVNWAHQRPTRTAFSMLLFVLLANFLVNQLANSYFQNTAEESIRPTVMAWRDQMALLIRQHLVNIEALRVFMEWNASSEITKGRFEAFAGSLTARQETVGCFFMQPLQGPLYLFPPNCIADSFSSSGLHVSDLDSLNSPAVIQSVEKRSDGKIIFLNRTPLFKDNQIWGQVGEWVPVDDVLAVVKVDVTAAGLQMGMRDRNGRVFWGSPAIFNQEAMITQISQWDVAFTPTKGWQASYAGQNWTVRILGALLGLAAVLASYGMSRRQEQSQITIRDQNRALLQQAEVRRQAETRLRETEALTQAVLDSSLQSFIVVNGEGNIILANRTARETTQRVFGRSAQPGVLVQNFLSPIHHRTFLRSVQRALQGEIIRVDRPVTMFDGCTYQLQATIYPVHLAEGGANAACMSVVDATDKKLAEENLRQSEKRFVEIFQANPVAMGIVTLEDQKVIAVNRALVGLLRINSEDLVGKDLKTLKFWHKPEDRVHFEENMLASRALDDLETVWTTSLGQELDVNLSCVPLSLDGAPGMLVMAVDVSARNRSENERQLLFHQVLSGRRRLQDLTRQLVTIQEAERQHISRELHDEAGQAMTALAISLELLQGDLPPVSPELNQRMSEAVELTHQTLDLIRSIAQRLRPPALDALGLVAALGGQCQAFTRRTQIPINTFFDECMALPEMYNITLYRCLQEALTNVAKHAHAHHVWVELRHDGDEITLTIEDDGNGYQAALVTAEAALPKDGLGLVGLQERLEVLGGRLEIETEVGKGTRVLARLPATVEELNA